MLNLEELHKECHDIFRNGFFYISDASGNQFIRVTGASTACRVYDKLTEGEKKRQDCIGENFNQLIQKINDNWFENYKPTNDLDYYFFNYFLLLYLFWERVDLIFKVIKKVDASTLYTDFHQNHFITLRKINKWANFIKHPKEFLFTHWATYYLEGDTSIVLKHGDVKIDTKFITNHYTGEKKERPIILENNNKVYVEIPDLKMLTIEFCKEMNDFFDFICHNQNFVEFLKEKYTIENHDDSTGTKDQLEVKISNTIKD